MDLNHTDRLRLLTLNDAAFIDACTGGREPPVLEPRTAALIRLAALIAVGGAVPSYGELVDAALDSGASPPEIVDVLLQVMTVAGVPRVIAEAPKLALALGYDVDEALESHDAP